MWFFQLAGTNSRLQGFDRGTRGTSDCRLTSDRRSPRSERPRDNDPGGAAAARTGFLGAGTGVSGDRWNADPVCARAGALLTIRIS